MSKSISELKLILLYIVIAALFVSTAVSSAALYVYHRHYAVQVVSIDLKGHVKELKEDYASRKITEEQFRSRLDDLETLVKLLPDNYVVLTSDVVVKNGGKTIKP